MFSPCCPAGWVEDVKQTKILSSSMKSSFVLILPCLLFISANSLVLKSRILHSSSLQKVSDRAFDRVVCRRLAELDDDTPLPSSNAPEAANTEASNTGLIPKTSTGAVAGAPSLFQLDLPSVVLIAFFATLFADDFFHFLPEGGIGKIIMSPIMSLLKKDEQI